MNCALSRRDVRLTRASPGHILNHMVQYSRRLDSAFGALADPTRRGILERLGRSDAGITELAEAFDITLTGVKKNVGVLESAGLVTTQKVGRGRRCRLGPRWLDDETEWIAAVRPERPSPPQRPPGVPLL